MRVLLVGAGGVGGAFARIMARRDGGLFWCRVRGRTLTHDDPLARAVWSFADISDHRPCQPLTPRERQIVMLLGEGGTSKEIAQRLGLSHRTVENHVQNTLTKLQLHNRAQLVRYAVERGLAD